MTDVSYTPRVVDEELAALVKATGGVVLEGPKACGKTMTARQIAASEVLLDVDQAARAAASLDASLVLEGATPRLIDEWQLEPGIWNHIRRVIDDRGQPGQFILTGSAVPADDITRHTGAGRITRLRMRPMSLYESGHSTGAISLESLLAGEPARAADSTSDIRTLADRVCVGGWPAFQKLDVDDALRAVQSYLEEIRRTDINRVEGGRKHDPDRVGALLRSLARNVATAAKTTTIADDTAGADRSLARDTVYEYLHALERLMIVEDQPAWRPHLRSRAESRVAPKRHFVDPSLAVAALGASPQALLNDLNYFGLLFESLVIRDLRIYAQAAAASVVHYRDSNDLEVDAIVNDEKTNRWGAFEVKLGGEAPIDQAAASLLKFAEQIDTKQSGKPAVLGVIVGTGYGFVRKDGVAVIPITALRP